MARSHASSLVNNSASDDEIAAAITDTVRDDLYIALAAALDEYAPANPAVLVASIGAVVGLVGMNWSQRIREEFTELAMGEFARLPGALVLDALARARSKVNDGRFLVTWVYDDIEQRANRLSAEVANLTRLAELAQR